MKLKYYYKNLENVIYLIIWSMIFILPYYFEYNLSFNLEELQWSNILSGWLMILPLFIVFIINNFFLGFYLYEKRYFSYSFFLFILLVIVGIFSIFSGKIQEEFLSVSLFEIDYTELFSKELLPKILNSHLVSIQSIVNNIIVFILVVAFNDAIKIAGLWFSEEQTKNEVKWEKVQLELNFLKQQTSPNLFMNTLNNIHSYIDMDKNKAKAVIIKLSRMMKYLLYESSKKTTIKMESSFLESYFDLMKLRYHDNVRVEFKSSNCSSDRLVPPLLFIDFIEIAFKYGVDLQNESFVECSLNHKENYLLFTCNNSILPSSKYDYPESNLEITKKRLYLFFNNHYELKSINEDGVHKVSLKIMLA